MVPPFGRGVVGLHTPVLDGEHIAENTLLVHRNTEQLAAISGSSAELLARSVHALVLALQLELLVAALLRLQQLPGAVDGPVAEVAVTGEAEGTGGERVMEEVAD